MTGTDNITTTGNRLFAGKLAGRGLLDAPGFFRIFRNGRMRAARAGARGPSATTHANQNRAPQISATQIRATMPMARDTPVFHCPLWPGCGCQGVSMRPECPGLKSRIGQG
ncbi:MAG: hypothetical protein H5U19_08240 [Rhodobacteraceae bacterium]|nr:hypothetical protein [Paracoccaceae bacterium]